MANGVVQDGEKLRSWDGVKVRTWEIEKLQSGMDSILIF